jgi:hypothetical protein
MVSFASTIVSLNLTGDVPLQEVKIKLTVSNDNNNFFIFNYVKIFNKMAKIAKTYIEANLLGR